MHCPQTPLGYHSPAMSALKAKQFISLRKGAKTFSGTNIRLKHPTDYRRSFSLLKLAQHLPLILWHMVFAIMQIPYAIPLSNLGIILKVCSMQSC